MTDIVHSQIGPKTNRKLFWKVSLQRVLAVSGWKNEFLRPYGRKKWMCNCSYCSECTVQWCTPQRNGNALLHHCRHFGSGNVCPTRLLHVPTGISASYHNQTTSKLSIIMSGRGKGGKGLGKGGAKRHRKILRDNIQGTDIRFAFRDNTPQNSCVLTYP